MQQHQHTELINYIDLAKTAEKGESAVVDFVVELFKTLGYARRERLARTRVVLPLLTCGEEMHAKTDVCIVDRSQNDILLLAQADKRLEHGDPTYARAQLVAAAVGAFNENNAQRDVAGLPPLEEKVSHFASLLPPFLRDCSPKVIPGIVMAGTSPAFFKIPVTQTLSTHIRHGTYPSEETRVTYCYPSLPHPGHRRYEGMKPLDNRREILKCFEAFKVIVGI